MTSKGADDSASPANGRVPGSIRDEVNDAWILAVADTAKSDRGEQLHVWLTTEVMLQGGVLPTTIRRKSGHDYAEAEPAVAVAWFEPSAIAPAQTLTGTQCEAHVESAIILGLPRWGAMTLPGEVATWSVRSHPMGLGLHDPTGQVFAQGVAEITATWTTAAIAHGWVVAVYGVGPQWRGPQPGPLASSLPVHRLAHARQAGLVAAARLPLRA